MSITGFQIGQCRLKVDVKKTIDYYAKQNTIPEDCECKNCLHYFQNVIKKPVRIFEILTKMGVDIGKNENDQPDGVWHTGERKKFKNSYLHHYTVFGTIGKTTKSTLKMDSNGKKTVTFFDNEADSYTEYSFIEEDNERIVCRVSIECDRLENGA